MHADAIKDAVQQVATLEAEAYRRGFDDGWAACKARYDKQRAEQGERLDGAGTSGELMGELRSEQAIRSEV